MATHKTTHVTNIQDVGTFAQILPAHERGILRAAYVTNEITTAMIDNADDLILFMALPSNAIVHQLWIYNDDLDSNGTPALACDVGLYYGLKSGANAQDAVIDADCFASAITTLQAENTAGVNIRFESGVTAGEIAQIDNALWEVGGLSTDPKVPLVIGLDITTAAATAAAGTITLVAYYTLKGD
jgi:hypothetical protein